MIDMTKPPIRVMVVDDHTLFWRGLTALLARDARVQVEGDAADTGWAQRRAQELQPDVILLDNHLPGVVWMRFLRCRWLFPLPVS